MEKTAIKKFSHTQPVDKQSFPLLAEQLITSSKGRATRARINVLAFLLQQQAAVSHQQIAGKLEDAYQFDRVTLYRVLDWLIEHELVHKVIGPDRVWRFRANSRQHKHEQHAHFKCNRCTTVICLHEVLAKKQKLTLPEGYQGLEVELIVKGLCARCS